MSGRTYEGPPLDGTYQHFAERPYNDPDGETVDVVDADQDAHGEETVEDVPVPDGGPERPDAKGQTTWADWEGST